MGGGVFFCYFHSRLAEKKKNPPPGGFSGEPLYLPTMESVITRGGATAYLTQIFDILTKIRAYNIRDFDQNFRNFDNI